MSFEPRPGAPVTVWPWVISLGTWLLLSVVVAVSLWQMYRDTLENRSRELALLSLVLTDEINRGLNGAEEGMRAIRIELRNSRLLVSGLPTTQALQMHAELMPLVDSIWLLDRGGHAFASSDATPAPDASWFVPAPQTLAEGAPAISRPFTDPTDQEPMVALIAAFTDSSGLPGGFVAAGLPESALLGAFSAALSAADARMAVFRGDGLRLAGANAEMLPHVLPADQRPTDSPTGVESLRLRDGSEALVSIQTIQRYGLKVLVSRDRKAVLASWQADVQLALAGMVLALAITLPSQFALRRALQRFAEAQNAMRLQRTRSHRLEALGWLASAVAHDFNHVLTGILGYGELAQDMTPPGGEQARYLEQAMASARRGQAQVKRILSFGRGTAREPVVFELEPAVAEVLVLIAVSAPPGVVLQRDFNAQGACLRGDEVQVFDSMMNLCTNALQAMPDGGTLNVSTKRIDVDRARILSHSHLDPGRYVVAAFADEGPGITSDVMDRLFEPFFTTRTAQSGTGLGLAGVFGMVTEFKGAVDVASTPGKGATFTLYLPECTDPPTARQKESPPAASARGRRT